VNRDDPLGRVLGSTSFREHLERGDGPRVALARLREAAPWIARLGCPPQLLRDAFEASRWELADGERLVLLCKDVFGESDASAGELLGLPAPAVARAWQDARRHLAALMARWLRAEHGLVLTPGRHEHLARALGPLLRETTPGATGTGAGARPPARVDGSARERAADLAYEMAKACLRQDGDLATRVVCEVAPRRPARIGTELARVLGPRAGISPRARRFRDTMRWVHLLRQLEGTSPRQRLAQAVYYNHVGQPRLAELTLRPLVARGDAHASSILHMALLRQGRAAAAYWSARAAARERPDDPHHQLNCCFALARSVAADDPLGEMLAQGTGPIDVAASCERVLAWGLFERHVHDVIALHAGARHDVVRLWMTHHFDRLATSIDLPGEHRHRLAGAWARLATCTEEMP